MERPTQPDQIRVGEEEAGMFFQGGGKASLEFSHFFELDGVFFGGVISGFHIFNVL